MDFYNKLKKVFSCLLLLGLLCSTAAAADSDSTGDRIWDEDSDQDKSYTWNYLSYSGFYYDLDSGLGSEEMKIEDIGRTIDEGKLIYTTEPLNTDFEFKKWGEYQVIGFMAEKYFAGYLEASDLVDEDVSLIQDGALSKILLDSDESISVHTGSSLELKEGYSLYIAQVDINGEKVWVQLKKDDKVVDEGFIGSKQNYIYEADLGDAEDIPIIIVRFGSVFSGRESTATFIEGIFQISDECTEIESGDTFGEMEITSVDSDQIKMKNEDDISLKKGNILELMGKLKLRVADDNTLRFAPVLDMSEPGTYELRGTVYDGDENTNLNWTHLNFEGFYYNIDEGIGTEELRIKLEEDEELNREISDGTLIYSTKPQEVEFEYGNWGKFQVIGFMAEKYFAGYTKENTSEKITNTDISLLSDNTLSKVLIDSDEKKSVYTDSSLELEEGYVLNIQEVDLNGEKIWVQLEKDGEEVDNGFVSSGETYAYEKDLEDAEDVPIILVNFDSVFAGSENNAAFIKGIFQISEDCLQIESGETFGEMEISSVDDKGIKMKNEDDISLSKGKDINIMNNIKFKVADSSELRFYPFVEVNTKGSDEKELKINVPSEIYQEERFKIKVTAKGNPIENVALKLDGKLLGSTDEEGSLSFTPETRGKFKLSAEKEAYTAANKNIEVLAPKEIMDLLISPEKLTKGDTPKIEVVKAIGGEPIKGAEVFLNGDSIGFTGSDGTISSTLSEAGTLRLQASKEGFETKSISLSVEDLKANFVFSELRVNPSEVKTGKEATISVKVTNKGNAAGIENVELLVNGNVTNSKELSLEPSENSTLEFIHMEAEEGNYTIQIEDQTLNYEVVKKLPFLGVPLSLAVLLGAFGLLRKKE